MTQITELVDQDRLKTCSRPDSHTLHLQVVMCSGVMKDGSLRIVRNGIGMIEQASVELPGIKGMWNLRATNMDAFDKYLVLSFVGETRVLAINEDDELDEAEVAGFNQQSQVPSPRASPHVAAACMMPWTCFDAPHRLKPAAQLLRLVCPLSEMLLGVRALWDTGAPLSAGLACTKPRAPLSGMCFQCALRD